jgi:hypothetical protein
MLDKIEEVVYTQFCMTVKFVAQSNRGIFFLSLKGSNPQKFLHFPLENERKNYTACSLPSRDKTIFKTG